MKEFAFGLTADAGVLERQALGLARSIRRVYPEAPIVVYVPGDSRQKLAAESRAYFEAETDLRAGPYPDPDYPITAQLKAFEIAAEETKAEATVMLDTDVLLLDELTVPERGTLFARPCTLRGSFWSSVDSIPIWREMYEKFDIPLPKQRFSSALGGQIAFPFYNSAVVIARDPKVPGQLLEWTQRIFEKYEDRVVGATGSATPMFYSDQVALSLLSNTVDFRELQSTANYPVPGTVRIPDNVEVLHYGDFDHLATVHNSRVVKAASAVGLDAGSASLGQYVDRTVSALWFRIADRLPYSIQQKIRDLAGSRHAP